LPRGAFQKTVEKYRGDRYSKGFSCWDQLVAMVYAQLGAASSLREIEAGFNQHRNHHYHLGTRPIRRTTLSDANQKRNPQIFADTAMALMQQAGGAVRKHRQEMLYLLDSTSIALRGRGSQWTKPTATRTPGLKLHLLYDSASQLPRRHSITHANINDIDEGRRLPIETGATYVFDKGYCDYNWWSSIDAAGARFVTRLKTNAAVKVLEGRPVSQPSILADEQVRFANRSCRGGHRNLYTGVLRRIEVKRPGDDTLVLVTNDLAAPAQEIASLYKDRWQIELFFKWIKQHLSVKRFVGESENAVRIQLLTALIAYLLVAILNRFEGGNRSLWMLLAELRAGLFQRAASELLAWKRRRRRHQELTQLQPELFR
jgi:putative transposase